MGRKSIVINLSANEREFLEAQTREKAWIINIACQKPIDFGYAAETWTYVKLTSHINKNA